MAERASETPEHFSQYVVEPNLLFFRGNSASLHAAFNAVMSIDALAGHIFKKHRSNERTDAKDDSAFRQELSKENEHFNILRDTAKSYKHVSLNRGSPTVTHAEQTIVGSRAYGSGLYGTGSYGGQEVMIELDNGEVHHCLSIAILAHHFLEEKMKSNQT